MPGRGGFVARHAERPKDAVLKSEKSDDGERDRTTWRMPNGNSVQETREYVFMVTNVFDKPKPFVLPMTSTNHTPAREWMSLINEKTIVDKPAAIFTHRYRITTVPKKNDAGSWYMKQITDPGLGDGSSGADLVDDIELYRECRRIHDQFKRG